MPAARLAGSTRLRVFGFEIYDARLWVAPDFRAADYARHAFALELAYLRSFEGKAIAERSIREMRGIESFSDEQAQKWQAAMIQLFPDVKKGDRLTGIYRPGGGVSYLFNDKPLGEIQDALFARLFMGIWLSPKSSEPAMRQALLGGGTP